MNMILAIAAGGALGAVLRHFVGLFALRHMGSDFPWGTLSVNVIGSFLMGALIAWFAHSWNPPAELRGFLTVGMLGAFTTFSTFSLDTVTLWERGATMASMGYVLASVVLSIGALFAGMMLLRQLSA